MTPTARLSALALFALAACAPPSEIEAGDSPGAAEGITPPGTRIPVDRADFRTDLVTGAPQVGGVQPDDALCPVAQPKDGPFAQQVAAACAAFLEQGPRSYRLVREMQPAGRDVEPIRVEVLVLEGRVVRATINGAALTDPPDAFHIFDQAFEVALLPGPAHAIALDKERPMITEIALDAGLTRGWDVVTIDLFAVGPQESRGRWAD